MRKRRVFAPFPFFAGRIRLQNNVVELRKPSGSEDYSLMLKRVVERGGRGAMFRWGCRHHGHHKSDFDIQDTETMPVAFGVFTGCVLRFNGIDSGATD